MADGYIVPNVESFKLPGKSGRLVLEGTLKGLLKAGKISEHDALIGRKLGNVLKVSAYLAQLFRNYSVSQKNLSKMIHEYAIKIYLFDMTAISFTKN